jgi:hypothetical protein
MLLIAFRKFWWIPLLFIATGYFLLPSQNSGMQTDEYSVSTRIRTRPAFAAELQKAVDHFCDSSTCLTKEKNISLRTISTRQDEYNYIDIRISSSDSLTLLKLLPGIESCIQSDEEIRKLIFYNTEEINRLIRNAKKIKTRIPASDSLNHFIIEKNLFDLSERERDIRDIYLYSEAQPDKIVKSKNATGGSILKRMVILTIIGLFLMLLIAEVSRRRNSQHD